MPKYIPEEKIELARKLRASGMGWTHIGRAVGCFEETIRRRIDDDYRVRRNKKIEGARVRRKEGLGIFDGGVRITEAESRLILARVPVDTRTILQKFMGDPLPGRSALDRRRQASASDSPTINTIHTDQNEQGVDERASA